LNNTYRSKIAAWIIDNLPGQKRDIESARAIELVRYPKVDVAFSPGDDPASNRMGPGKLSQIHVAVDCRSRQASPVHDFRQPDKPLRDIGADVRRGVDG
jgi:hypothetical protein